MIIRLLPRSRICNPGVERFVARGSSSDIRVGKGIGILLSMSNFFLALQNFNIALKQAVLPVGRPAVSKAVLKVKFSRIPINRCSLR